MSTQLINGGQIRGGKSNKRREFDAKVLLVE